jgi:hypothetical protein
MIALPVTVRLWEGGDLFYVRTQPLLKLQINADCFILLPGFVRPPELMPGLAKIADCSYVCPTLL